MTSPSFGTTVNERVYITVIGCEIGGNATAAMNSWVQPFRSNAKNALRKKQNGNEKAGAFARISLCRDISFLRMCSCRACDDGCRRQGARRFHNCGRQQSDADSLKIEMKRLKTEDPSAFAYNQRPGVDMLSIIAGEMVVGLPQMSGRGFMYADETTSVSITRAPDCPGGDCPNGIRFFFAGRSDVAMKTLNEYFHDDSGTVHHTPVTDARKLVEAEIQASPEDVGPPITILQVDKSGPTWISNDAGCPIVASAVIGLD